MKCMYGERAWLRLGSRPGDNRTLRALSIRAAHEQHII